MSDFDLVIRNGTVATAADTTACDIGIKDGVVATLGKNLGPGAQEIDASGRLVLPGGIDSIAAALQDVKPGGGSEVMARRDRVLCHGDGRPMRK